MNNTFKKLTAVVAVLFLTGSVWAAEHPTASKKATQATGALDGKVFVGEMGKVDEAKGDADTLIFKNGTFTSTACREYGFSETPYKTEKMDGSTSFSAMGMNKKKETMTWKGTVTDGKVEATAEYKAGPDTINYWYKGSVKKKSSEHPKKSEHPRSEHPK